jgi:hypothetical protein
MLKDDNKVENLKGFPFLLVGIFFVGNSPFHSFIDCTHSYITVRFVWYTQYAVKYERWSRYCNVFSVDMWICFNLPLVLAVITVHYISNWGTR